MEMANAEGLHFELLVLNFSTLIRSTDIFGNGLFSITGRAGNYLLLLVL